MSWVDRLERFERMDRRWVFLGMFLSILLPLLVPVEFPFEIDERVRALDRNRADDAMKRHVAYEEQKRRRDRREQRQTTPRSEAAE